MAPQTATRMTYEEFLALPVENFKHYELIEGELYVNPAPNYRHQIVMLNIYSAFRAYLTRHRIGEAITAPADVMFSRENVLQPDVMVFLGEHIAGWKRADHAPDIAVEVLSEGSQRHDKVTKRRLYQQYGVREYWIADPEALTIAVIRGGKEIVVTDKITTPLLPGFELPLTDVFSDEP
jgi:Uncharacterized protein conserved in cyanobacteria